MAARDAMDSLGRIDFERRTQLPFDVGVVRFSCLRSDDHNNITRRLDPIVVSAEELAHHSLNPIPHDCAADSTTGCDPDP